ncbi:hypothetical protein VPH35_113891 [Triticum aestivum]|uniref:uncharacterized protein n=1 Tax=Triticum aestivum TaxID=4565 RepID=UPI0003D54AA8|nr:uncharacterized protein LOC123140009 [Triticum aestivum]XP_044415677.1 uncharacterized protein LOC123140009 [Triticum aestivum]
MLHMDQNAPAAFFIGPDGVEIDHLNPATNMRTARAVLPDGQVLNIRDPELWAVFDQFFDPAIHDNIFARSRTHIHPALRNYDVIAYPAGMVPRVASFVDPKGNRLAHDSHPQSDSRLHLPDGRFVHVCDPYIWVIFDEHLSPNLRPIIQGFQHVQYRGPPISLNSARAHAPVAYPKHENTNTWIDVRPRRRGRAANVVGNGLGQAGGAA